MPLAHLSSGFQSLPPLSTSNLGPSSADSQVGGLVYMLRPCCKGLPNELSCEAGNFSCCLNPHRFFQSEILRLYFPALEPWIVLSVSLPGLPPGVVPPSFLHTNVGPLGPLAPAASTSPSLVQQSPPCCKSSLPWLLLSVPPTWSE